MGKSYAMERAKFERQQRQQAELYRRLGMDEGQIQAMYDFDLQMFRSNRRYEKHTQPFLPTGFDNGIPDESKSVLFEKFLQQLSAQPDAGHCRDWWVEEIEHPQLAQAVRRLDTAIHRLSAFPPSFSRRHKSPRRTMSALPALTAIS